ncbi:hypothetical protein AUK22_10785 [bacterium CG2_30_54_10]|nr:MAG: hypothetical protein AUK22_10785 [bacterium CG2_30_54_10]
MNRDQQNMLNSGLTRDREIVIARRIAPKQSRDAGDCFASLWSAIAAMTTKGWSLADLGSHDVNWAEGLMKGDT